MISTLIQIHVTSDFKIFSKKGLTRPGLEQSNLYNGIAGEHSSSITEHTQYTYLPLLGLSHQGFFPTKVSTAISP